MMGRMRAVRVREFSTTPVVEEVPDPTRTAGHTIVRVAAATVGHIDRSIWSGSFARHPPLPYTPGVEGSGVVVDSDEYAAGERVWVRGGGLGTTIDGTWAELVVAPDASLGRLPDAVDYTIGSAFFSPCTSAWVALHSIGQVRPGQHVLVTGANGAVGSIAVQLANEAGADVTGTVSRPEGLDRLPQGVRGVVLGAGPPALETPADLVIDTVGGSTLEAVLPHVRAQGTVVLVGYVAGSTTTLDLSGLIQRDVTLRPLNMIHREPEGRAVASELLARFVDGTLTLPVTTFPFDRAADALAWLTERGVAGRAVLVPDGGTP